MTEVRRRTHRARSARNLSRVRAVAWVMLRTLLPCTVAAALALCSVASAAPPAGVTAPSTLGTDLQLSGVVAAADAAGSQGAAVAFTDRSGGVWAARVRGDGSLGAPLPAASSQLDVRDVSVVVTDRGELVAVWAALVDRRGRSAVRYAVAEPGRSFSGARTIATVGSVTGATPRVAALRGGTVAVFFRDGRPPSRSAVLRYARRAPHGSFGTARSLGRDGVFPQIQATPGGGALLAWAQGPQTRRALMVATADRGAPLPGRPSSVAGRVHSVGLFAGADGTAWVTWTNRASGQLATGGARRIRAANVAAVGPVRRLGTVTYGSPHAALGATGQLVTAWNQGLRPTTANVQLAAGMGAGTSLGATTMFDAGGFSQTSPIPALLGSAPLVVFTRQVADATGAVPPEVAVADPATGETAVLGGAGNIGAPAVARAGAGLVVAWAARGGGVAVTVIPDRRGSGA
jgi:hypothetical protein